MFIYKHWAVKCKQSIDFSDIQSNVCYTTLAEATGKFVCLIQKASGPF